MPDHCANTVLCNPADLRQAFSIHTRKITDSCRDKDCIEDLRVWLTRGSQGILDKAATAKVRCADLINTYIEVEPVAFDRNHYCIDVTFYDRILADAIVGGTRPAPLTGLAVFTKRVVLCGEDSRAHIYRSTAQPGSLCGTSLLHANQPAAVVEVLDPMVLSSKVRESDPCGCEGGVSVQVPDAIRELFDEPLVISGGQRQLFVALGQFSIIRMEREAQLIVPVLDYAMPYKECCDEGCGSAEDPCEMFSRIPFPSAEFSPRNCDPGEENDCHYKTC